MDIVDIILLVVLTFGAAIPVTQAMITNASLTGTNAIVAGITVTSLIIVVVVKVLSSARKRTN